VYTDRVLRYDVSINDNEGNDMNVFITGDRTPTPIYPGMAAIEMIRALGAGDKVVTGDNGGVEAMVREIAKQADVEVEVIASSHTPEGKVDWDSRHVFLGSVPDMRVVAIHADPHASSVVKSLFATLGDDQVTLRTPVDLLG
jgi:hypothetical protein